MSTPQKRKPEAELDLPRLSSVFHWYDCDMKVISGTVVAGKIDVPEGVLAEGDRVAIVASEPAEPIQLTEEQEAELAAAVEDIRNGRYLDGQDLLAELRKSTGS